METPKEPWNFCETPEEKCTMNYCDDNGCQNRKRNLVEPKKSNLEQQIEKLEAEKEELLEALENSTKSIEWYMENTMPESDDHTDFFNIGMNQRSEIESLIQKHKQ